MKLALAPIPYYWTKEEIYGFYAKVRDVPVDIVYLGETVCVRRNALTFDDWMDVGQNLVKAGKEIVMASQVLVESDESFQALMRMLTGSGSAANDERSQLTDSLDGQGSERMALPSAPLPAHPDRFMMMDGAQRHVLVEANDMGAVRLLGGQSPFVAGMHLNIYNPESLKLLVDQGAKRWVMPLEMSRHDLQQMLPLKEDVEVEVFAYGRIPLAFSARCFTARHASLPKDDCHSQCLKYPEGLALKTQEQLDFLVLNGPQTLSHRVYCLLHAVPDLKKIGVDIVRIVPQREHTARVVRLFAEMIQGSISLQDAERELLEVMPSAPCNGYWHQQPAMEYVR